MKALLGRLTLVTAVLAVSACAQKANLDEGMYSPKSLDLAHVTFKGGKAMDLTVGIGSGAFHHADDPANVFYTVSDRGPNVGCEETQDIAGVPDTTLCMGDDKGKVFPTPDFAPSIYKIALNADRSISLLETVTLKNYIGQPVTGLSNPIKVSNTEKAFTADGQLLAFNANGLDVESLVKMNDGTFWVSEEYAPSLAHVAKDGRIIERWVPAGLENDLKGAAYKVKGVLPGIIKWRPLNRGIESISVSPDQKFLYFAMQSPLANPDAKAYKSSDAVRLFKMDIKSAQLVGEWVYPLDDPKSFKSDNAKKERKLNDVKVSEMSALGMDRLLVLERISKTTKFYIVDLKSGTNIADTRWDAEVISPSLEQLGVKGMSEKGVDVLNKSLALNTDDHKDMPEKIEGIGVVDAQTLMLINDNDFGIIGDATVAVVVHVEKPLF